MLQARGGWFVQVMVEQRPVWTGIAVAPVCAAESADSVYATVERIETVTATEQQYSWSMVDERVVWGSAGAPPSSMAWDAYMPAAR